MDFFEVVKKRYSHKERFLPDSVPLVDLKRIAQAGIEAPSGVNRQTVHLIILPDRQSINPVCAVSPTCGLETAPAAIAILTDSTITPTENAMNFEKEDYSATMENILLATTALGYSALWLDSPYFDPQKRKEATAILGAPETFNLWAVVPIGKPDGEGSRREKLPFSARVSYGTYGTTLHNE